MSDSIRIVEMPDLGAVDDTSSVVGERAGSGRFAASALRSYALTGVSSYALSGLISVKDFGAKGDNTTDDTAAFNAALASVAATGGGKLLIPAGDYLITTPLSYSAGSLSLMGDGARSTIRWGNTTANLLNFTGSDIRLSDFRVVTPFQTSTAGVLFNFANANNAKLSGIWTDGGWDVVHFLGASGTPSYRSSVTDCNFVNVMNSGVFYDQYFGGAAVITGTEMLGAPSNHGNGIIVYAGDTFNWCNINIQGFVFGVYVAPTPGGINYVGVIHATNVLCDGGGFATTQDGWYFGAGTGGAYSARHRLTNCWGGSCGRNGFNVVNASDVTFTNCIGTGNVQHGFQIFSPSSDITLMGCTTNHNGHTTGNTYDGIHVVGPVTDFIITNCRCRPNAGDTANTQRYGIFVDSSANNRYIISNNDLNGNVTGGLSDSGTGASKFVGNNIT